MSTPATHRATARPLAPRLRRQPRVRAARAATWPHTGASGRDVILARVASMSFVAALDDEPRAALLAQIDGLLDTHPDTAGRDDVAMPYVTELFTTRKLHRAAPGGAAGPLHRRQLPGARMRVFSARLSTGRGTA